MHGGITIHNESPREELDVYLKLAAAKFEDRMRNSTTRNGKLANPYRFLSAYGVEDYDIFFGRNAVADELLAAILGSCHESRLTVVHAGTGAGKTSLLQAGLGKRLITEGHSRYT